MSREQSSTNLAFLGRMLDDFNGARDRSIPPQIDVLAPFHFPGPLSLYCAGKHGPSKQCKTSLGSRRIKDLKSGLHPTSSAISSI